MLVKVVVVQARLGQQLSLEEKIHIFKQQPDFVCLPEYFFIDENIEDYRRAALKFHESLKYCELLSEHLSTCLITGSVVEVDGNHLHNTSYVINRGLRIGRYRKRYPVTGELKGGLSEGNGQLVVSHEGVKVGVLICADVFHPELFHELASAEPDIIFVPTTSLLRPHDSLSQKEFRDRTYFVSGAMVSGAYVVKTCGVGRIFGKPLQGRSLVAAPWGVIARTDFAGESEKRIICITLDISELREFRSKLGFSRSNNDGDFPSDKQQH